MSEDALAGSWGLADDLLSDLEAAGPIETKYLIAEIGDEIVAIPDAKIAEVVDRPKVTPWLIDELIAGVFALRGDIYTLTDPLQSGNPRRIAVLVQSPGRFVAIACDRMVGVESIGEDAWEELESPRLAWARRLWKHGKRATIQLDPELYLDVLDSARGKDEQR